MSSSVPIPQRKPPSPFAAAPSSTNSSWSSSASSSSSSSLPRRSTPNSKGKEKATDPAPSASSSGSNKDGPPTTTWQGEAISPRRPSLLGRGMLRESLHTVIQLGNGRLVTCVKSSQGFDWNQELFLPSYASEESSDLEHKPDPVEDILLTEEELAILPQ